jgi:hypothetical protein
MQLLKHQNAASSVIAVTGTATALYSLINTAGSVTNSQAYFNSPNNEGPANGLMITPEDGNIRLGYGVTPTASLGMLLSSGTKYFIPNVTDFTNLKLIRTGSSNVSCSVDLVKTMPGESPTFAVETVTLETGDITLGAVELKDGATDTRAVINAANTARAATDNVILVQTLNADGTIGGGLSQVDDTAFTPASSKITPMGAFCDETSTDSVDEGDIGAPRMTADRNLYVNLGYLLSGEDQTSNLLAVKQKPSALSTYCWDIDKSVAYEASSIAKASAGVVRAIEGYNSKTSAQFIQLHNSATLPADTGVPDFVITVPASSNFSICFGENGYYCSAGIVVSNSSTGPTKTIGSADCWYVVKYK